MLSLLRIFAIALLSCSYSVVAVARPVVSHAFSIWIHHTDPDKSPGQAAGDSSWNLGRNYVKYGELTEAPALLTDVFSSNGTYQGGGGSAHVDPLPFAGSVGFAHSDIAVTPPPGGKGLYDFTLTSKADADADFFFAPKVEAFATGHDPQGLIAGTFTQEITLGAGSSIYASDAIASATSRFEISVTNPDDPFQPNVVLASIELDTTANGGIDATVIFSPEATFFSPTGSATSSSLVESLLETNQYLRSPGGLLSDLPLFSYQFSMSYAGGEFFASVANDAQAQGVPEPTTLALLGVGLAGIGFGRRRRLN